MAIKPVLAVLVAVVACASVCHADVKMTDAFHLVLVNDSDFGQSKIEVYMDEVNKRATALMGAPNDYWVNIIWRGDRHVGFSTMHKPNEQDVICVTNPFPGDVKSPVFEQGAYIGMKHVSDGKKVPRERLCDGYKARIGDLEGTVWFRSGTNVPYVVWGADGEDAVFVVDTFETLHFPDDKTFEPKPEWKCDPTPPPQTLRGSVGPGFEALKYL